MHPSPFGLEAYNREFERVDDCLHCVMGTA
jgi:hypothetical protein